MTPRIQRAPEDIPGNQDGLINDQTLANRPDSESPQGKAKGKAMPATDNSGMGYGSSGPASPVEDQARD